MSDNTPIIVTEVFNCSLDTLWQAITDRDEMVKWYFDNIPSFKPEVGHKTQFNIHHNGRDFFHIWKIMDVVPKKSIAYSWEYKGYEGSGEVIFNLLRKDDKTHLKLTAKGMESFPQHIPEFRRESCIAGWNFFIKERLKAFLEP